MYTISCNKKSVLSYLSILTLSNVHLHSKYTWAQIIELDISTFKSLANRKRHQKGNNRLKLCGVGGV